MNTEKITRYGLLTLGAAIMFPSVFSIFQVFTGRGQAFPSARSFRRSAFNW